MNKYAALCTAALVVLSVSAVAGANAAKDGMIKEFEANGDTYYLHESGLYKETNDVAGLQLESGTTLDEDNEPREFEPDKRVEETLAP